MKLLESLDILRELVNESDELIKTDSSKEMADLNLGLYYLENKMLKAKLKELEEQVKKDKETK